MNSTKKWLNDFSPKQLTVFKYALLKADAYINHIEATNGMDAERRAAFIAGFYTGYDLNGGELPPEPTED